MKLEDELKGLIKIWKRKEKEFFDGSKTTVSLFDSNRYEGISRGLMWCISDLEEVIEASKPKPRSPNDNPATGHM